MSAARNQPTGMPLFVSPSKVIRNAIVGTGIVNVNEIGLERTITFRNGFTTPVILTERSGFAIEIPPLPPGHKSSSDFIVDVRYSFKTNVILDKTHLLDRVGEHASSELKALRQAIRETPLGANAIGNCFSLTYSIESSQLNFRTNSIYVKELDITLSLTSPTGMRAIHPYSEEGLIIQESQKTNAAFRYDIEIVDPNKLYGDRYCNISNVIYKIQAHAMCNKAEGVYLTCTNPVNPINPDLELIVRHYPFDTADKELGLYRTADEARTYGDLLAERKRDYELTISENKKLLADRDYEFSKLKNDHEAAMFNLKSNFEQIEHKLKMELQASKAIQHQLELDAKYRDEWFDKVKFNRDMQQSDRKFEYDMRSINRKDFSEFLKWLPSVIAVVAIMVNKKAKE